MSRSQSLPKARDSPGKVTLERRGPRIRPRDSVAVVGPDYNCSPHITLVQMRKRGKSNRPCTVIEHHFEVHPTPNGRRARGNSDGGKLNSEDMPSYGGLDDIGSVKAVDAAKTCPPEISLGGELETAEREFHSLGPEDPPLGLLLSLLVRRLIVPE